MDFTKEQIQKAMTASKAEELLAMAKEEGIDMTLSEAEAYYSQLHQKVALSEDELGMVAGGKGERIPYDEKAPQPVYYVGQRIRERMFHISGYITDMHLGYYSAAIPKTWFYTYRLDNGSVFVDRTLDIYVEVESVD